MKQNMGRGLVAFICMILCSISLFGCQRRESPEDFLKSQLDLVTSSQSDYCSRLLEEQLKAEGIDDFPDELVDAYTSFLREAYGQIKYEITGTREDSGTWEITLDVSVLDLGATVETINSEYVKNMQSDNLATEVKELLVLDQDQLAQPVYASDVTLRVNVTWDEEADSYTVDDSGFMNLLETAVTDRLATYNSVAELFDIRDYVVSCLDAAYKGEFDEYTKQTGMTEEQASQDYENSFWDSEMDSAGFSDAEKEQLITAMKEIAKSADYTVGLPVKDDDGNYSLQVTGTACLSFRQALEDVNSAIENGSVQDEAALRALFVETFQNYAKNPVWGDAYTATVHVVSSDGFSLSLSEEDSQSLMDQIMPQ